MKRINLALNSVVFFYRNLLMVRNVSDIKSTQLCNLVYRGMHHSDLGQVAVLYFRLNREKKFSLLLRWLYFILGKKLMLVVVNQESVEKKIVGINMYYLNRRDIVEGTIHEGFIGVLSEKAGMGIATNMRKIAKDHFSFNEFKGVSTRISLNNGASLCSALKGGFRPVDNYYDEYLGEERVYMVCDLGDYHGNG